MKYYLSFSNIILNLIKCNTISITIFNKYTYNVIELSVILNDTIKLFVLNNLPTSEKQQLKIFHHHYFIVNFVNRI